MKKQEKILTRLKYRGSEFCILNNNANRASLKISIGTVTEEMKFKITEYYEFEQRDQLLTIASTRIFCLSKI